MVKKTIIETNKNCKSFLLSEKLLVEKNNLPRFCEGIVFLIEINID